MGPVGHTLISGAIGGGVWLATDSKEAAGLALGVGVLMDLDHLYDYYQWYVKKRREKVYVLLHAWEYSIAGAAALALAWYHPLLLAVTLAHFGHVTTDHFHNHLSRFSYSIIYRVVKRFDGAFITPSEDIIHTHRKWRWITAFDRPLERWLRRKVERWFERKFTPAPQPERRSYPSDD